MRAGWICGLLTLAALPALAQEDTPEILQRRDATEAQRALGAYMQELEHDLAAAREAVAGIAGLESPGQIGTNDPAVEWIDQVYARIVGLLDRDRAQ